jgi:hypothetical protein
MRSLFTKSYENDEVSTKDELNFTYGQSVSGKHFICSLSLATKGQQKQEEQKDMGADESKWEVEDGCEGTVSP